MSMHHFFTIILLGSLVITEVRGMEENFIIPKEKEERSDSEDEYTAGSDEHRNAHLFHERLCELYPECFQGDVQAYYKEIERITSRPQQQNVNGWDIITISIDGSQVMPDANKTYAHNGISFNLRSLPELGPDKSFRFTILHNTKKVNVQFKQFSQRKIPVTSRFDDYETFLTKARNHRFSLCQKITFKGVASIPGERPHTILIEANNNLREPLVFQGLEFVFNKNEGRTLIFFDCVDITHEPVELIPPKEFIHSSVIADQSVFCIKDKKASKCEGKTLYSFFNSPETRRAWAPDESNFYDITNNRVVPLPSCYKLSNEHEENADDDPTIWILNDNYNSFYQVERLEMQDANDYLHCDNELFYVLSPYTAVCKEYLSHDPTNQLRFDYLVQVKKPGFRGHSEADITGGHRDLASGLYKRITGENNTRWKQVAPGTSSIEFTNNRAALDIIWPAQPLNIQEIKEWCKASQRFFILFNACIHRCDREIANNLSTWNKLNCIDLSRIQLTEDINWNDLFTAIGTMQQLEQLSFAYNHPVTDVSNYYGDINYDGNNYYIDTRINNYYQNLITCLGRLTNLKSLRIQGLWLKHHSQLGSGCSNENSISTEIAALTYFINYKRDKIRALINQIHNLPRLVHLNIDSIPNHGNSNWARFPLKAKILLAPVWLFLAPSFIREGFNEDESLKQLVRDAADRLAQIPSLRTLSVYSPGGNCVDYFSHAFRERLAATRTAHTELQPLTINAEVLQ